MYVLIAVVYLLGLRMWYLPAVGYSVLNLVMFFVSGFVAIPGISTAALTGHLALDTRTTSSAGASPSERGSTSSPSGPQCCVSTLDRASTPSSATAEPVAGRPTTATTPDRRQATPARPQRARAGGAVQGPPPNRARREVGPDTQAELGAPTPTGCVQTAIRASYAPTSALRTHFDRPRRAAHPLRLYAPTSAPRTHFGSTHPLRPPPPVSAPAGLSAPAPTPTPAPPAPRSPTPPIRAAP